MFAILKKARRLGLDLDIQLQLFDSVVAPVALYGCEVWGFGNTNIIDKLQVRFCKILLKAKRSTPTCMVLGELGRLPIQFNIESRMLGFWFRCLNGNGKISCSFYKLLYKLHTQNVYSSKWLLKIRNILDKCGLLNIWNTQDTIDMNYVNFKNLCKRKLRDYYTEEWNRVVSESSKCFFYKEYKKELVYENYLNKLDVSLKYFLIRFRTSNHKLPIEYGRYFNVPKNDRKCLLCNLQDIGDEYHYFCICPFFNDVRQKFIPNKLIKKPSVYEFCQIMKAKTKSKITKLARFARIIMNNVTV
jgi:hypothetical protein